MKYHASVLTTKNVISYKSILTNQRKGYAKQIVPKDHEPAQKLLDEKKDREISLLQSRKDSSKHILTSRPKETVISVENTTQLNQTDNATMQSDNVLKEGFSNDHNEPQKDSRPGTIQTSMQSFLVTDEKEKVSPVDQIQGNISRILVMLESLAIPENGKQQSGEVNVNHV